MEASLEKKYSEWAAKARKTLLADKSWEKQYKDYAQNMLKNKEAFVKARKLFRIRKPLYAYLTIGKVSDGVVKFDLRYLGQSVGTLSVKGEKVSLTVSENQAGNSKKYFKYNVGSLSGVDWATDKKAIAFRKYYAMYAEGVPRQKEHMVESALFSETEKTRAANKTLCYITPVSFANTRIHMKTALMASDSKKDTLKESKQGGEIDLLCRRSIKAGRGESRLVAIEVKDENKKSESFDNAMKQAISYAVFVDELMHSDAGKYWMELWGMKNQKNDKVVIECVVAMPKGDTKPSYCGECISYKNSKGKTDYLSLNYMELKNISSDGATFDSSLK